jgi:hypothetical protein
MALHAAAPYALVMLSVTFQGEASHWEAVDRDQMSIKCPSMLTTCTPTRGLFVCHTQVRDIMRSDCTTSCCAVIKRTSGLPKIHASRDKGSSRPRERMTAAEKKIRKRIRLLLSSKSFKGMAYAIIRTKSVLMKVSS